jgi:phytoene dehydrogenase-like protein
METYDTVILGAGLDGLACGVRLARAGRRVAVVDPRPAPGGLAEPMQAGTLDLALGPDRVCLPRRALLDLGLEDTDSFAEPPVRRHVRIPGAANGAWRSLPATLGTPLSDGGGEGAGMPADPAEASAFAAFTAEVTRALALTDARALNAPADPLAKRDGGWRAGSGEAGPGDDLAPVPAQWRDRAVRLALMPLSRLLEDAGLAGPLAGGIAQSALEGTGRHPAAPGSAAALLLTDPLDLSVDRVAADPVRLAPALARRFEAAGGELRLNTDFGDIERRDDRIARVTLADGEALPTRSAISCLDVKRTLLTLIDWKALPEGLPERVTRIEAQGMTAKLVLILKALPESLEAWRAPAAWGRFTLAESVSELERAAAAAQRGRLPDPLPVTLHLPPRRRDGPAGPAVAAVLPYVPFEPFGGDWNEAARHALAEKAISRLDNVFPGLRQAVSGDPLLLLPKDYEAMLGLAGGSWTGAALAPHQLWAGRPLPDLSRYRTPVRGLYLGGPDMHPGGLACAAGLNAAAAVLADRNG